MINIRRLITTFPLLLRRVQKSRAVPSLVTAMKSLVPRKVLREVVATSSDRRQWGVLAAAWVGVSEHEFTQAAAQELKLEFFERAPVPELPSCQREARAFLEALRKAGAVPISSSGAIVGFIAVDPAEVRVLHGYREGIQIGLSSWSEISRALDSAERRLAEDEAQQEHGELHERMKITGALIEMIMLEAAAHGARSVEIISTSERCRYQFMSQDGRSGVGNIRSDVVGDIIAFLSRFHGSCYLSSKRGEVLVRSLGASGNVRLSWGQFESDELVPPQQEAPLRSNENRAGYAERNTTDSLLPIPFSRGEVVASGSESASTAGATDRVPILVVDDNPMFCRVLERLLERDGFNPHFAPNGGAAWERLANASDFQPRAIVCDLHMPIMNGQELLERVRGDLRLSTIPFIMLTSDEDVNAELTLLARGADAFVSKTKDPRVLCAQIRRISQRASLQEAA